MKQHETGMQNAQPVDQRGHPREKEVFVLHPNEIVVNQEKKPFEDSGLMYSRESQEKGSTSRSREDKEREGNAGYAKGEKMTVAKRFSDGSTLQKIRHYMEVESKGRKKGVESSDDSNFKTKSFFKLIPNVQLDLGLREYPVLFHTEANIKTEEHIKGGIIPLKKISHEEDSRDAQSKIIQKPIKTVLKREEANEVVDESNCQQVLKATKPKENIQGAFHTMKEKEGELGEEERDDACSEKHQQYNAEENEDDDDKNYEVEVNPNVYIESNQHEDKEEDKGSEEEEYEYHQYKQQLQQCNEDDEENFEEIKKFMKANDLKGREDYHEDNDPTINQIKQSQVREAFPQKEEDKDVSNKDQEHEDDQEDLVKIQKTEGSEYADRPLPLSSDQIEAKKHTNKEQNCPHVENKQHKYKQHGLVQQSSIQYEHHPLRRPIAVNEEYTNNTKLNYEYSTVLHNYPPKLHQGYQSQPKDNRLLNQATSSCNYSRNQPMNRQVKYSSQVDNDYITEQRLNPSNLYTSIKTETNQSIYQHDPDYLQTEIAKTEQSRVENRVNSSFVERTAKILNPGISRSKTIERSNNYEELKSKYQRNTSNEAHEEVNRSMSRYHPSSSQVKYQYVSNRAYSSSKRPLKGYVAIPERKEGRESDMDLFNLHYNYSNEELNSQLAKNAQKPHRPVSNVVVDDKAIQDAQLPQQIFKNNYDSIDMISKRNITYSLRDDLEKGVSRYFDYTQARSPYAIRNCVNRDYAEPCGNAFGYQSQCSCKSSPSREDFESLYLKAFNTFSFKKCSYPQSITPRHTSNKLCLQCQKEIYEQSVMHPLL